MGADRVSEKLIRADAECVAHALNLCEVFYDFYRARGPQDAAAAIRDLARAGVGENTETKGQMWRSAGVLKAVHKKVSLADCFAIALANTLGATVLTCDHHEFDILVAKGVCSIEFIR